MKVVHKSVVARNYLELGCSFCEQNKYKLAYSYFHKAALLGDKEAQLNLGNLLLDGKGVKQNQKEAIVWYKKSAKQGGSAGAYNIAIHYRNKGNWRWAKFWFRKALVLGEEDAAVELANLSENAVRCP